MRNKKLERWNWKSFLAGVVCSVAVFALGGSAVAATVGAMSQNQVNIIANGTTISKAGQNYVLSTGVSVPGSITYTDKNGGGTVYLPIRRLADILGTNISWDGSKNAVVVGQSSSTQPTEPICYSKYPSILSIENIGGDLTYYTQNEVNYPQFGIYSYYYSYKTSTFENAKKYAKEYSDYLEKNGYSKTYDGVYETMPTILGEPSHEYKFLTPDKSKLVSVRYEYKAGQGGNTYYITINIENSGNSSEDGMQSGTEDILPENPGSGTEIPDGPDIVFDRDSVSEEDILKYLQENIPQKVETPLGTYSFKFDVYKNSNKNAGIDFWITTSAPTYPSWYEFENSLDLNQDDVNETLSILKEYQEKVYSAAWECAPGAKMEGSFHSSGYKYPSIQEGYHSTNVFSWKNYGPNKYGAYDETYYTGFEWTPQYDDYKF